MRMKITRKELWLLAAPLLVVAFALMLGSINNYAIQQEEQRQLKPSLHSDGSVMVSRQRQPDGSIREFLHAPDGSRKLLNIRPASEVYKPRGLFQKRYLVYGMAIVVAWSLICLPFVVVSALLRRKQNRN